MGPMQLDTGPKPHPFNLLSLPLLYPLPSKQAIRGLNRGLLILFVFGILLYEMIKWLKEFWILKFFMVQICEIYLDI